MAHMTLHAAAEKSPESWVHKDASARESLIGISFAPNPPLIDSGRTLAQSR
jgi:hypothetical protein